MLLTTTDNKWHALNDGITRTGHHVSVFASVDDNLHSATAAFKTLGYHGYIFETDRSGLLIRFEDRHLRRYQIATFIIHREE